jgi:hypothetical protein
MSVQIDRYHRRHLRHHRSLSSTITRLSKVQSQATHLVPPYQFLTQPLEVKKGPRFGSTPQSGNLTSFLPCTNQHQPHHSQNKPKMSIPTPNKSHTVSSSGHKYSYIHYPPSNPTKPTLLFLHGFPSTSHDWRHQITHFKPQGYGILAPDLLGYGETSKPSSPSSYVGSIMSADIVSILDHEKITGSVIGIAHDWGTYLLSQMITYYPERLERVVFLSVPFNPPGRALDVHLLNKVTKEKVGYEQYGYWLFLTEDGAGKTIGKHVRLFCSLFYFLIVLWN